MMKIRSAISRARRARLDDPQRVMSLISVGTFGPRARVLDSRPAPFNRTAFPFGSKGPTRSREGPRGSSLVLAA